MEYFGAIYHFHKVDSFRRQWHVYADVDELGEIDFIYVQPGILDMPNNGTAPCKCKSSLLKRALQHVEEELANVADEHFDVIDIGDQDAISSH